MLPTDFRFQLYVDAAILQHTTGGICVDMSRMNRVLQINGAHSVTLLSFLLNEIGGSQRLIRTSYANLELDG